MGDTWRQPKSLAPSRPAARAVTAGQSDWTFYHGTPDERTWDQPHGAAYGLHIGTEESARQALNARIGTPLEGDWDGTREYGKTLLKPYTVTGAERNLEAPRYPSGRATYSTGHQVPMDARPSIFPVRITGPMTNHPATPMDDAHANGRMRAQITRGQARRGYFYRNAGEDYGSVSAVVPSAAHLERVHPPKEAAQSDDLQGMREQWNPGDWPHFEYHCQESHDSQDASLWYRSHQRAHVLGRDQDEDHPGPLAERLEAGMPRVYRVRFGDGHEGSATEDELLTHPRYFQRPDPPQSPREAARWQPGSGIFGPTTGLDPDLFDEHGRLRPDVRHCVMTRLDQCIRTDSGLAGSDWQDWTRVYLLGGSVSEWAGPRPNGTARDLDVIVAIDLHAAQGYGSFEGMNGGEAASALNKAFHLRFNDEHWEPSFGGTWSLTAFCNQRAQDGIAAIRPYAAWDLTRGRWAVQPPHLPEHTIADFDPAALRLARAVASEARAVLALPEPLRTREATALWKRLHEGRDAAFSGNGVGWADPGNLVEKWLAYNPGHLLEKIKDLVHAPRTAAAQVYLRNPYHGNPEFGGRPEWSHTWFHGTKGTPDFGTRRKFSDEAQRAELPPEQRKMNSGWTQPNQHLGIHFSPLHEVAHKFVGSVSSSPGALVHARLRFDNPAVFPSEEHLNIAMADWGSKHYPHWHDDKLNGQMGWSYGDQEGTRRDYSQVPDNPRERWHLSQKAQSILQWHPHMPEILNGFRRHLADQGHHGIIYGNSLEGPYETDATRGGEASMKYIRKRENWPAGHPYSFSAIAHPDDIEVTHVEHVAPWREEPQGDQRTWEDISDTDEPDEVRDKVLDYHRQHGGELPGKTASAEQPWVRQAMMLSDDFRRVITTTPRSQLVLMTLKPGEEIGSEVHEDGDQHFVVLDGTGHSVTDSHRRPLSPGDAFTVPAGTRHNVTSAPGDVLRLATVYAPPQHPAGTVHPTKADAERAEGHEKTAAWQPDTSGSDSTGIYLRFGPWPADERSYSFAGGYHEDGVSAYDLDREGDPAIGHGLDRVHQHDEECDPEECTLDAQGPDNDPQEEMRGRVMKAERNRRRGSDRPRETGHLVRGKMTGVGYDGEPLLQDVRRVGDWIDHRHLFIPGAQPHRLARHPLDEEYEEPEEKPPPGRRQAAAEKPSKTKDQVNYRDGTDARHCGNCVMIRLMPPDFETHACTLVKGIIDPDDVCDEWSPARSKTGAREEQLAGMDPRTRATALAQEQVRMYHPLLARPLETRNGQSNPVLTRWLSEAGHPGAEHAYVAAHPDPGSMQSNTGRGPDGEPVVVLHPDRWDYGTAAHEAAHLITDHQAGRAFGEPHGPEGAHSPQWARNYATLLNQVSKGAGGHFISQYRQHNPQGHQEEQAQRSAEWRAAQEPQRQPSPGLVYLSVPHGTLHALPEGMRPREETATGMHHVTVAHLPRTMTDDEHREVLRHAAKAAAASPPLEGTLGGMETFPRNAGPEGRRVAFVPASVPGIERLHADLAGVNASPHAEFHPHVTVAYLRRGQDTPDPHPEVPVRFTHLHVEHGGKVHSFPLAGEPIRREAAAEPAPRLYHGTRYNLSPGDMLEGGARPANNPGVGRYEHVYMHPSPMAARAAGSLAYDEAGYQRGQPNVYEVEPLDHPERDPFTSGAVRSRRARVLRKVDPFTEPDPEAEGEGLYRRQAAAEHETWYHLTDNPYFGLDPEVTESDWFEPGEGHEKTAATGYDLKPRTAMIYLDLPPGTVRPVPGGVDDHHVTLVYLGSGVSDEAFAEARRRAQAAAAGCPPMDGVLRGIDIFPPSKGSDGKVVAFVPAYVGGIGRLRRELEDLSASEHKDWKPHVTLAYLKKGDSLPAPHPAVPLRFTHLHVKRGDDVVSFPLTGP